MLFIISMVFSNHTDLFDSSVLKGPYLGQKPPGMIPEIFAENIISMGQHEHGFVISPKGNIALYAKPLNEMTIMQIKTNNEFLWSKPEIAPFSGIYKDMSPCYSSKGDTIYFTSKRPLNGNTDLNIWIVKNVDGVLSKPLPIGFQINTKYNECNPSVAENGNLYFQYFTNSGLKSDIYYSKYSHGKYNDPIKLPSQINTKYNDASPFIAHDESYILFHSDRPGGHGYMDIYICYKQKDGTWSNAKNLGPKINTYLSESNPYITPDGKYLFYSNYFGPGKGHIYWIDAKIIDELRQDQ